MGYSHMFSKTSHIAQLVKVADIEYLNEDVRYIGVTTCTSKPITCSCLICTNTVLIVHIVLMMVLTVLCNLIDRGVNTLLPSLVMVRQLCCLVYLLQLHPQCNHPTPRRMAN